MRAASPTKHLTSSRGRHRKRTPGFWRRSRIALTGWAICPSSVRAQKTGLSRTRLANERLRTIGNCGDRAHRACGLLDGRRNRSGIALREPISRPLPAPAPHWHELGWRRLKRRTSCSRFGCRREHDLRLGGGMSRDRQETTRAKRRDRACRRAAPDNAD